METEGDRTSTARWTWLRPGRHPGWLWPVAILLGFPIGGLIADLVVNVVDSVGAALAAGRVGRGATSASAGRRRGRPLCDGAAASLEGALRGDVIQ